MPQNVNESNSHLGCDASTVYFLLQYKKKRKKKKEHSQDRRAEVTLSGVSN